MCDASLPTGIDKSEALIILIVNIIFPGVGTWVAACIGDGSCGTVMVGLAQLLLSPFIVGWVWAICWSLNLRKAAIAAETAIGRDPEDQTTKTEPYP